MNQSCSTCLHSATAPVTAENFAAPRPLMCKRYPPSLSNFAVGMQIATATGYPAVDPNDKCGEYAPTLELVS